MKYQPEILCEGFIFPETPRWHRGSFYCTSIDEGTIFKLHDSGQKEVVVKIDDWLSGWVFPNPDSDEILLTSSKARKLLSWDGSRLEEYADLSGISSWGINDMVMTREGICFVGAVNFKFGEEDPDNMPSSPIIRVTKEKVAESATDLVEFPNGMLITPDNTRLIVADSMQSNLHQFDLAEDGGLSNHHILATVPDTVPDGISLDAEGGIWVAAGRRGLFRVDRDGEVTDEVDMGSTGATACMLGGTDGKTLLITASDSHDRKIIHDNPSGRVFVVRVDVPGVGLPSHYSWAE